MNAHLLPRSAVALALGATLALGLTACNEDETESTGSTPSMATPTDDTAEAPAGPDAATGAGSDAGSGSGESSGSAVGVYYAGKAGGGLRLYREFRSPRGDRLDAAARLVDGGEANDPDYRTLWPGQTVTGAEASDSLIEVDLNADAFTEAPDGMSRAEAELAIQQMVYTLQGVVGERLPVQFVRTSGPEKLFGIDVSEPVKAADWEDALAPVNVTTPEQDSTVTGDTLKVSGVASAFEGTVQWRILSGDAKVLHGFTTTEGWMDKLYPWEASIDVSALEPGEYTFVASDSDAADAGEGNGPTEDSKTFTLR